MLVAVDTIWNICLAMWDMGMSVFVPVRSVGVHNAHHLWILAPSVTWITHEDVTFSDARLVMWIDTASEVPSKEGP